MCVLAVLAGPLAAVVLAPVASVETAVLAERPGGSGAATVTLRGGTLPEAVGRGCILIAVSGTLDVTLQNPLGTRQVLTAFWPRATGAKRQ